MAKRPRAKAQDPSNENPLSSLDRFLTGFVQLTSNLTQGMLAQSTDADEKEVIAALGKPLNEQVLRLTEFVRERAKLLTPHDMINVGQFLKVSSADTLVESGSRLAVNLSSTTAKIGLSDIFDLIKKIIRRLFPKLPDWVEVLIEILNEIKDFFMSVGSPRLASTLSRRHQDLLAELTQLERLQRESAWRFHKEEEEEE